MAKRANGEGTKIVKVPDRDLYKARYTDTNGKRRTVYGKTKSDVREKLTEGLAERDKGLTYEGDTVSLQEHLDRWLETSVKGSVKPITYEAYERMCRVHIKPSNIGKVKLSKLTPGHLQRFYQEKLNSGLASASVRYMHATLHRALKQAHRWRLVRENVAAATDPPIPQPEEIRPLTAEQVRLLLTEARGERLEALFLVAVTAGLRIGELSSIQWSDLDMESSTLRVRRTLSRAKNGPKYTTPKNGKGRNIKLTVMATEALKRHRIRQHAEKLAARDWQDDNLIFCREDGRPLTRDMVARSNLKPVLKRAGLPQNCTPHQLRHTCATLLLSRGVHPKFVQELLGHSSIAQTLDRYSHWIPSMGEQTATAMEAALS